MEEKFAVYILIIGIPLNFIGEYLQVILVHPIIILPRSILAIFAMTCDLISIFLIHFLITKIYKNALWARDWNINKIFIIIISEITLTALGERIALAIGLWRYTTSMPVIPIINVGLTPIFAMATLPLVTLYFASKIAFDY